MRNRSRRGILEPPLAGKGHDLGVRKQLVVNRHGRSAHQHQRKDVAEIHHRADPGQGRFEPVDLVGQNRGPARVARITKASTSSALSPRMVRGDPVERRNEPLRGGEELRWYAGPFELAEVRDQRLGGGRDPVRAAEQAVNGRALEDMSRAKLPALASHAASTADRAARATTSLFSSV